MAPEQTPDNALLLYTIYYNPSDWPGEFVIKRWHVLPPQHPEDEPDLVGQDLDYLFNARTLQECRDEMVRLGLTNIGRQETDDKVIVESWV